MADLAAGLVARGHRVKVLTSARGYEDARRRYERHDRRDGVEIRRLGWGSLGKRWLGVRVLGQLWFLVQCLVRGLTAGRVDVVLITTSPPMVGLAAMPLAAAKRSALACWVMDVNPDQIVAQGELGPHSFLVRGLEWLNRRLLRRCDQVIALDRFMARRLEAKVNLDRRLSIVPPWPHEKEITPVVHEENPFRSEHGLVGKLVLMYSGNHSPANPLATVIEAAVRLADREDVAFLFVGGGLAKGDVERAIAEHRLRNVTSLPYQPFERLRYSLSAADVHLVTMGEDMVGCIHPCKVYGAMAAARPILYVGPEESHIGEIVVPEGIGWRVSHGDVDGFVRLVEGLAAGDRDELRARGELARSVLDRRFGRTELLGQLCARLESGGS